MTRSTTGAEPQHSFNHHARVVCVDQAIGKRRPHTRYAIDQAVGTHDPETLERLGLLAQRVGRVAALAHSSNPDALAEALASMCALGQDWMLRVLEESAR